MELCLLQVHFYFWCNECGDHQRNISLGYLVCCNSFSFTSYQAMQRSFWVLIIFTKYSHVLPLQGNYLISYPTLESVKHILTEILVSNLSFYRELRLKKISLFQVCALLFTILCSCIAMAVSCVMQSSPFYLISKEEMDLHEIVFMLTECVMIFIKTTHVIIRFYYLKSKSYTVNFFINGRDK